MAKVYDYKLPNPDTGEMVMPPFKGTKALIERYGGTLLTETEEEVADTLLDKDGHYDLAVGDRLDDAIPDNQVAEKPPVDPSR